MFPCSEFVAPKRLTFPPKIWIMTTRDFQLSCTQGDLAMKKRYPEEKIINAYVYEKILNVFY
jgi:hypothetical protein